MEKERLDGMVDISGKNTTKRTAVAQAIVKVGRDCVELIREKKLAKGDTLEQSKIAGIMAAKKTPELLPLCHPIRITDAKVQYEIEEESILIKASVTAEEKTGVEMEALTAATIAALNIYDMCKMYTKDIEIQDIFLVEKIGGKSGHYKRKGDK